MDLVEINPTLETGTRKNYRGEENYIENLSPTVGMGLDQIDSIFKKYFSLWYQWFIDDSQYSIIT
jgi:hypothetical protein